MIICQKLFKNLSITAKGCSSRKQSWHHGACYPPSTVKCPTQNLHQLSQRTTLNNNGQYASRATISTQYTTACASQHASRSTISTQYTMNNMPAAPPSVHSILQHVPQSQRVSTTNYYFTSVGNRKIIYKCCKKLRSAQANKMARRSNDTILLVAAHRRVTFPSSWKTT